MGEYGFSVLSQNIQPALLLSLGIVSRTMPRSIRGRVAGRIAGNAALRSPVIT